jgi:hypothetical protein
MKRGGSGVSLPSAMAISGAAVNPDAGNSGGGLTHDRLLSTLFSLLNIRLGYWARNPGRADSRWYTPTFVFPGLKGGVFGGGFSERNRLIELTDGGHFENLALYELARRKLGLIVVSDAGADPQFDFDDLGNAVERIRVDFGARVRFDDPAHALAGLLPGTAPGGGPEVERYGLAQRGYALGSIEYADGSSGTLLYVKATMIEGLPQDVYSYRAASPQFPQEPTSDQFFNERQFEAYRELGFQLGLRAAEAARPVLAKLDETRSPER